MQEPHILDVRDLCVTFHTEKGSFDAVSDMNFTIKAGEIFCLVGESGCGKSLTAKAILRLTPENTSSSGQVLLQSNDLLALSEKHMRAQRGKNISMIFQEPMTALNPVLRVGEQCTEHVLLHSNTSPQRAKAHIIDIFRQVGIPSPENRFYDYPHQLSGGMRQRIVIAMALACAPALLLADEPTTALDVTIQWQILQLLQKLAQEEQRGILLITHDLGVVAQMAHKVGVMYAGHMVEYGTVQDILQSPKHPYTQGLLHASPSKHAMNIARLPTIEGSVPPLQALPSGCRFHPRCAKAQERCTKEEPPFIVCKDGHKVRCFLSQ